MTCLGSSTDPVVRDKARAANGCDATRAGLPHVHTKAVGGITVIAPGWWIFAVPGGPWAAQPDATFRAGWEIPEPGGVTHEQVEAALATKTCQHCDAVTQLDEPHWCPQMGAVKEANQAQKANEAHVGYGVIGYGVNTDGNALANQALANQQAAEHVESNPYHESTATGNLAEEIPAHFPIPPLTGRTRPRPKRTCTNFEIYGRVVPPSLSAIPGPV